MLAMFARRQDAQDTATGKTSIIIIVKRHRRRRRRVVHCSNLCNTILTRLSAR